MTTITEVKRAKITFGKRVKELRCRQGLSINRLAQIVGMNNSNLSKIERGEVDVMISTIARVASALGVEMCELLTPDERNSQHLETKRPS